VHFEIGTYTIPDPSKSWFGTIVSVVLGGAQITLGTLLFSIPDLNTFTSYFATSLIAGGIGDIISAGRAIITSEPIDLQQYLKDKVISLGINIMTAGVLHFLQGVQHLVALSQI
jgi:hypothetical protein